MYQTKRERTLSNMLEREGHLDEQAVKSKAEREALDKASELNIYRSFIAYASAS